MSDKIIKGENIYDQNNNLPKYNNGLNTNQDRYHGEQPQNELRLW